MQTIRKKKILDVLSFSSLTFLFLYFDHSCPRSLSNQKPYSCVFSIQTDLLRVQCPSHVEFSFIENYGNVHQRVFNVENKEHVTSALSG